MIKPTVGRVVWFWKSAPQTLTEQPLAAMVAHVWSDTCVNLAIFDANGIPMASPPTSIRLLQDEEPHPTSGHYCSWMPFQVGQAKAAASKA